MGGFQFAYVHSISQLGFAHELLYNHEAGLVAKTVARMVEVAASLIKDVDTVWLAFGLLVSLIMLIMLV